MKTSLLLLTHDRYQMTKYCVTDLLDKAGTDDFELLILDNGSKDERVKKMISEDSFPTVKGGSMEISETNIGIAAGFNRLLKKAQGENIVFLTNDIIVDANWLVDLNYYNSAVDKAGVTAIHCEGIKGGYMPLLNKNDGFISAWVPPTGVTFGISMINRDAFEAVGLMDETLGVYGREREQYAIRLKMSGFNNFYIPDQFSIHMGRDMNDVSEYRRGKDKAIQVSASRYKASLEEMGKSNNYKL